MHLFATAAYLSQPVSKYLASQSVSLTYFCLNTSYLHINIIDLRNLLQFSIRRMLKIIDISFQQSTTICKLLLTPLGLNFRIQADHLLSGANAGEIVIELMDYISIQNCAMAYIHWLMD